ncbi:MAG: hydroxymethylpyrimidine/phosphomethylpyrimidine kinase [Burkholderiaceae bacterium]
MTFHTTPPGTQLPPQSDADEDEGDAPACVMAFNANDPSGGGGLAADIGAINSVGAHCLPVVCGTYVRDTTGITDHFAFDDEAVSEQARTALEDVEVQLIKVGFAGSPENLSAIAQIASDYEDVPLVAYMPDLSWWDEHHTEQYLDAWRELLLPQTTVLVGNHSTLCRWLLPDWALGRSPSPRDLAKAAAELGVPYLLVTGIVLPEQIIENVLATPETVLFSEKFERFDAIFCGAGDTLSAALSALLASGCDLTAAAEEALGYLDRCLDGGFRPGMGQVIPDRLFWTQPETDEDAEPEAAPAAALLGTEAPLLSSGIATLQSWKIPHDTKH